jgi:hypothetical protein
MTTIFKTKNLTVNNNVSVYTGRRIPFGFSYTRLHSGFILMLKIFSISWHKSEVRGE